MSRKLTSADVISIVSLYIKLVPSSGLNESSYPDTIFDNVYVYIIRTDQHNQHILRADHLDDTRSQSRNMRSVIDIGGKRSVET